MADFTNPTNDELLYTFAAKNGDTLTTKNGSKWIWQGGQWYPFAFGSESKIQNLTATLSDGGVKSVGTGLVIPGRDNAFSGDAVAAQNTLYNSTAAGRAARRAGGVAVRWTDGTITKLKSMFPPQEAHLLIDYFSRLGLRTDLPEVENVEIKN